MNIILGIHAASIGGVSAFMAKVADTVCNNIYAKLNAKPIPKYIPMPPFRFLDDSETPIVVRIKDANEVAIRLWYSTSYCTCESNDFSYSEWWRYIGSEKPRQPRDAEGACLSE